MVRIRDKWAISKSINILLVFRGNLSVSIACDGRGSPCPGRRLSRIPVAVRLVEYFVWALFTYLLDPAMVQVVLPGCWFLEPGERLQMR